MKIEFSKEETQVLKELLKIALKALIDGPQGDVAADSYTYLRNKIRSAEQEEAEAEAKVTHMSKPDTENGN